MTKPYSLRLSAKDKGVKIFNNHDENNWRVLNLHFNNYEDAQFVRGKLEPVVDLLNSLSEENKQLKSDNKEYIKGLDLAKATSQSWASDVRELREQNCQLEKENEQLKQENKELRQYLCWQEMELEEMEDIKRCDVE